MNRSWALFFARVILGLIFFMAGIFKVFELGPLEHARRFFVDDYRDTFLPLWSLWAVGSVVPVVELLTGFMMMIGFRVREAAVAIGFILVTVTFGHLLAQPLYEFHTHVIPRLALLLVVLWVPREDDRFTVDALVRRPS